jgi:isoquinoline 1-oxidoreductase subunit beta
MIDAPPDSVAPHDASKPRRRWSRRRIISTTLAGSGALLIGWAGFALDDGDARQKFGAADPAARALNPWIRIATDGLVTFGIHRAEMGQGIATAISMILAEELDADFTQVAHEFTPVDRDYFNFGFIGRGQPLGPPDASLTARFGTGAIRQVMKAMGLGITISSASTVDAWDVLRPVAAATRALLVETAAARWGVAAQTLDVRDSAVFSRDGTRRAHFGELVAEAARRSPPHDAPLKSAARYRLIGSDPPRVDAAGKVDGSARFGLDVRLPGLRFVSVRRGPTWGSSPAKFDATRTRLIAGVEDIFALGTEGIVVLALNTHAARRGAEALDVQWNSPPAPPASSDAVLNEFRERARRLPGATATSTSTAADREAPREAAGPVAVSAERASTRAPEARSLVREYSVPFLAHACMEPMNATAWLRDGMLELWAPTQANSLARTEAARAAGLDSDQVRIHTTLMGGGFGRRAELDYVVTAARVASLRPGVPVQVAMSREEDLRHDMYRPCATARFVAVLDPVATLVSCDAVVVAQSVVASNGARTPSPRRVEAAEDESILGGLRDAPYALPELGLRLDGVERPIPVGFWRSVSHSHNAFFLESWIDELAHHTGVDPVNWRRQRLAQHPRALAVLDRLLQRAGAATPGAGRGLSLTESHGSIVAHLVETRGATLADVTRVLSAIDCGRIIRPATVRAQVEGSVVDGLWSTFGAAVDIRAGAVTQSNFHDFPLLRIGEVPAVEVVLIDSDARPGGVGEPAVPGVAPAVCNAIFAATGVRIRDLPAGRPKLA